MRFGLGLGILRAYIQYKTVGGGGTGGWAGHSSPEKSQHGPLVRTVRRVGPLPSALRADVGRIGRCAGPKRLFPLRALPCLSPVREESRGILRRRFVDPHHTQGIALSILATGQIADAGFAVFAGAEQPMILRPVPFRARPAEDGVIELQGAFGAVCGDFAVC